MGQKRVLLAFVEAVHLVNKQDRASSLLARQLRSLDCLANILHATEYRADGKELGIKSLGHQPRHGGLAGARRPPKNAAVGLARLKGQAQGHACAQQVLLPDHLGQRAGPQALRQRLVQATSSGQASCCAWLGGGCHCRIRSAPAGGLN